MENIGETRAIPESPRSELVTVTATGYSDRQPSVGISSNNPMRSVDSKIEGTFYNLRIQRNIVLPAEPTNGKQVDVFKFSPSDLSTINGLLKELFKTHEKWRCPTVTIEAANAERFSEACGSLKCTRWADPLTTIPAEGDETIKFVASAPNTRYLSPRANSTITYNHDEWKWTNDDSRRDALLHSYSPILTTLTTTGSNPGLSIEFNIVALFEFSHPLVKPETAISTTKNFEIEFGSATITLDPDIQKSVVEFTFDTSTVLPPNEQTQEGPIRKYPKEVGTIIFQPPVTVPLSFTSIGTIEQLLSRGDYDPLSGIVTVAVSDKYIVPTTESSTDTTTVDISENAYVNYYADATRTHVPQNLMNNPQSYVHAARALRNFNSTNAKLRFPEALRKLALKTFNK